MTRLSNATLAEVRPGIDLPAYDRAAVTAGIVHLGLGAFHRAHQAVFVDDCLARGQTGWGIIAASLRSPGTRDALAPQDQLYTYVLRDNDQTRMRVIGSILQTLVAPDDPERLLAALCDPAIRLVTLTITEKGYAVDIVSGRLDEGDAALRADIAGGTPPRSALGFLTEAIGRRRAAGVAPFAIVPCDNLPRNGQTLRTALLAFAALKDPALAAYIEQHVPCLSSMVDRIVPATTDADRSEVAAALGVEDAWPVVAEPAFAWIIEDRFPDGPPPFAPSGVRFVPDVEPYEHMKLRLLNGAHTAIAAIGRLAGFRTVAEAIAEPAIRGFVEDYWRDVLPTLSIDADTALAYKGRLLARFANARLPHQTAQIATDASRKVPQRLLAPLRERLGAGHLPEAVSFAVAAWIRSCGGMDDDGIAFSVNDPLLEGWSGRPDQRAATPAETVAAFLSFSAVFGSGLGANAAVGGAIERALAAIVDRGVLAALAARG